MWIACFLSILAALNDYQLFWSSAASKIDDEGVQAKHAMEYAGDQTLEEKAV
jgi:hypothetical protein